ncbi:MAG: zinc dependent phospholipase C family protein [Cytophagaceae bacterium]
MERKIVISAIFLALPLIVQAWGFFGHQQINKLAVFTLPPAMSAFYKKHIVFITENAVNPDKRRYAIKEEAPRHYIDLDEYGDSISSIPKYWKEAVAKFSEDSLNAHGIVPWYIILMKHELTEAFIQKDAKRILRLSADIGHYIADANVPLHTTRNYNGQLSNQHGIHGFWESRLPELFFNGYDFYTGKASYLNSPQTAAWNAVYRSHAAVDSVLIFEKFLNAKYEEDKKYSFEERGGKPVKVYSREYSEEYHAMLAGQVQRQMRASVKMVGDFWYTCWVDAGQPDLSSLDASFTEEEVKEMKNNSVAHEDCKH